MKYKVLTLVAVMVSGLLFYLLGYQTPRENFVAFYGTYLLLFGLFYWLTINKQGFSFRQFFGLAILFRVILLFSFPELSNDFFRFFWDGELITHGINPYAHTPNDLISHNGFLSEPYMRYLFHGMGELSQSHYSCYPPLNQVFFFIPSVISDSVTTNLIILKLIILLADIGVIFVGKKILEHLKMDVDKIWLYALNPFIILEFSGNVHFEGVMIFFLLCSIYFLLKENWLMSAIFIGLAIHIKLIPLMLLPFVFKKLKVRKTIGYIAMTALVVILLGRVFLSEIFLNNMLSSIGDYFVSFEFNASIFYVVREIGFLIVGYDTVLTVGPIMGYLVFFLIMLLALIRSYKTEQDIFVSMLFGLVIYYAFATTIHPWYISLILIFSVFTRYRFGLIWSFLVMLSYSAYGVDAFKENTLLLITEYVILAVVMFYEIKKYWRKDVIGLEIKSFFTFKNEQAP